MNDLSSIAQWGRNGDLNTVSFIAQIEATVLQIRLDGGWVEVGTYI